MADLEKLIDFSVAKLLIDPKMLRLGPERLIKEGVMEKDGLTFKSNRVGKAID